MPARQLPTKPTFFWQGVIILLPVAVLAVVSLISLTQDEHVAEQDARNRAAENAQGLARAVRSLVDDQLQQFLTLQNVWTMELASASQLNITTAFPDANLVADVEKWERDHPGLKLAKLASQPGQVLADGRMIQPRDYPAVPIPPKWFLELTPEQNKLWETLRASASSTQIKNRRDAFLNSQPSEEARLAAQYLFLPPEQAFGALLPSESGVSFEELACYRLLTATNAHLTGALVEAVGRQVTYYPSFVSPKLLTLTAALTNRAGAYLGEKIMWIQQVWQVQTRTREWLLPLRTLPGSTNHWTSATTPARWTSGPPGPALALFQPCTFTNIRTDFRSGSEKISFDGPGYEIWFVPETVIKAVFTRALNENQFLIPDYARCTISVADQPLLTAGDTASDAGRTESQSLLGSATQTFGSRRSADSASFELKFQLVSQQKMLAAERQRARLFGALILGAALTAFIGLLAARRAFHRQLQLNEQKSNFVSSVSHELRAPIASVRLMAENLERGKIAEPAKQGEYFHFIGQECRRLSSLVENVLDFSRIEQGRKQYDLEPADLVALTRATVKLMEPYATEKGVRLELKTEKSQPVVEMNMDGRAIQQALVNLIDNAVKHSPPGGAVAVEIKTGREPRLVYVSVTDHGPGIPAAEHEKIFERFYRLGSELRRETQGVGIGLSVVKHIVEAHQGRVTVQSQVGQGSRFTLELPVKE